MARFTSALSLLLGAGDEIIPAMSMARGLCRSARIASKLEECQAKIAVGGAFSDALIESGLFSAAHVGMIKSGDRAGAMPKVMQRLSEIYGQDSARMLDRFFSLVEPALISALSIIIGIILLCIMLPLIGILSSIG